MLLNEDQRATPSGRVPFKKLRPRSNLAFREARARPCQKFLATKMSLERSWNDIFLAMASRGDFNLLEWGKPNVPPFFGCSPLFYKTIPSQFQPPKCKVTPSKLQIGEWDFCVILHRNCRLEVANPLSQSFPERRIARTTELFDTRHPPEWPPHIREVRNL